MQSITYVGLDVQKQSISYCVKTAEGRIVGEGVLPATRAALKAWAGALEPGRHTTRSRPARGTRRLALR